MPTMFSARGKVKYKGGAWWRDKLDIAMSFGQLEMQSVRLRVTEREEVRMQGGGFAQEGLIIII